jgi:hypothetical protein
MKLMLGGEHTLEEELQRNLKVATTSIFYDILDYGKFSI